MLYLGTFFFILCAMYCAYALICDVSTQYIYEDSTGKIKSCPSCKACPAGQEPYPPCGSVVGLHDKLRECRPCKNNFYSAKKDFLPCQPCQKLTCVANEITEGTCETNKPDNSSCTGHCKKGYIWNSNKSACVWDEPKPSAKKDSGMPVGRVVGIVVSVVVAVLIFVGVISWFFKCKKNPPQCVPFADGDKKEDSCNGNGNMTEMQAVGTLPPVSDTEKKENTFNDNGLPKMKTSIVHGQEQCQDVGQSIDSKPFAQESTRGFVNTQLTADTQTKQTNGNHYSMHNNVLDPCQGSSNV